MAGVAALALFAAFSTDFVAAVFVTLSVLTGAWAFREARRFVIASRREEGARRGGLSDLAPLLEALPEPCVLVDSERRIAGANAAAQRQMAFQAQGQFLTSVLRQPDVLEAVQAAIFDGAAKAVEYETKAGVEQLIRCTVSPVSWGEKRGSLLVFSDQTARVSTERMRADFLANASHELRTPLASLSLLLETVLGPAREHPEERDRFLKMMQVQAERMRRLIADLLSLSRIELDEHIPPTDRADLIAVARETIDVIQAVAAERSVTIELKATPQRLRVVGERFQLAQVVQNLVDNAVKYAPAGTVVVVDLGIGGDREQTIATAGSRWPEAGRAALLAPASAANRSYAYLRVEDAGPGIARRHLPQLGGRFFRVERETGDEKGGTGLGLAIVKHIVNRHRGGLLVESQPGRGSAFIVYVELAEEP
jgi:two-component system, OmpR family, phosphate regulon sensor histidine kinase PhoR